MFPQAFPSGRRQYAVRAFTLIELLVVISLIATLSILIGPAMSALRGASGLSKSIEDVRGVLEQARAHAMAKNTYTYVGFAEVDELAATSSAPTRSSAPVRQGGTVVAGVAASRTGTRVNATSITTNEITLVSRLFKLPGVVITDTPPAIGGLTNRKTDSVVPLVDSSTCGLEWPGKDGVKLTKVIEFDPQGVARLSGGSNSQIAGYIEIALKQAHGGQANLAAIQVDGISGAVRVYRP